MNHGWMAGEFAAFKRRQEIAVEIMKVAGRIVSSVSLMRPDQIRKRRKLFGLAALALYLIVVALFGWITWENWQGRDWFGVNFLPQAQESANSLTFHGLELLPAKK